MKRKRILLILLLILLLGGAAFYYFYYVKGIDKEVEPKKEEKELKIVDLNSKTRPYAVMIDNHMDAMPHSGLQDAYLSYEIIVEGGLTRIMAIFKDKDTELIGPVRSSRHYFLDYAMENDAIYGHYGWSPQAKDDIETYDINNLNGLYSEAFWRDDTRYAPHNAYTNIESLKSSAKEANYSLKGNKQLLLNYSVDEINLDKKEDALIANNVSIDYSYYHNTSYTYDSVNKVYKRFMNSLEHMDRETNKQYTVKNIIVIKVDNSSIDESGRQTLNNIGTGEGYYITNGYAVPINWEKDSRERQTVYTYLDGKKIKVNDGNTYIQIQPTNQELLITE